MAKMRFEVRKDVRDTIELVEWAMTKNGSLHMSIGYLKAALEDTIMELPPRARQAQLEMLNRTFAKEVDRFGKNAA